MNDSSKLFLSAILLVICGFIKGIAPITLGRSFDGASFFGICIIAIIVTVLGLIKRKNGK